MATVTITNTETDEVEAIFHGSGPVTWAAMQGFIRAALTEDPNRRHEYKIEYDPIGKER